MNHADKAVQTLREQFNCAQAVLTAFSDEAGLERPQALKLACGFGAGIARTDQTCGAVCGAYLAIGLKHGRSVLEDTAARDKTYALIQEFNRRFQERHGSLRCTALIGRDLSTPDGYRLAAEEKRFINLCPAFVRSAAEILEALL